MFNYLKLKNCKIVKYLERIRNMKNKNDIYFDGVCCYFFTTEVTEAFTKNTEYTRCRIEDTGYMIGDQFAFSLQLNIHCTPNLSVQLPK